MSGFAGSTSTWYGCELVRTPSTVSQVAPPSVDRLMLVRENAFATAEYTTCGSVGSADSDTTRLPIEAWSALMPQSRVAWSAFAPSGSTLENAENVVPAS